MRGSGDQHRIEADNGLELQVRRHIEQRADTEINTKLAFESLHLQGYRGLREPESCRTFRNAFRFDNSAKSPELLKTILFVPENIHCGLILSILRIAAIKFVYTRGRAMVSGMDTQL